VNVALPPTRTLGVAGAVAIVLAAAIAGGWYWYDTQQRRVAAAYAEVLTRVYAAQSPQAPADERASAQQALEQILAQHPSAGPVAEAAYELGNLRGAYEIAAARGASPTVRALARTSIGYTWEAERDWAKAIETFQAVARELGPRDFLFDEVQFALARVQELGGKPADAITTYERVLKDTPTAPRIEEAKQQLMRLGASRNK